MNWGTYLTLFLISTVKFLFSPFTGAALKLSFFETYFSCVAGGVFSAAVFYFSSEYFMNRAKIKILEKKKQLALLGQVYQEKKRFTKTNKFIVRLKTKLGIYGISLFAPLLLSVPLGTIIVAKFYGRETKTFPLILLGMFANGLVTTTLAYFIF